jgi:hypothetical protein
MISKESMVKRITTPFKTFQVKDGLKIQLGCKAKIALWITDCPV